MRRSHGMALSSAILISMIMLILGMAFLYYLERDYQFAGHQARSQEAFYLALAGLQYQRSHTELLHASTPPVAPVRCKIPSGDPFHYVDVSVASDGTITSRGVVVTGIVVVDRTLVVRPDASGNSQSVRDYQDQSR